MMSIITVLALTSIALLFVVVLAACTSFPNRGPLDADLPDGDWISASNLSRAESVGAAVGAAPKVQKLPRPPKMHSWI